MRISAFLLSVALVLPFNSYAADSGAERLRVLFDQCTANNHDVACEEKIWSFADVAADDKLTMAEITRFLRTASEALGAQNQIPGGKESFVYWIVLGPVAAHFAMSNFDFDGDGKISKAELYTDYEAGQSKALFSRLTEAGLAAFSNAATMAGGQSPLGQLMPKNQTEPAPLMHRETTPQRTFDQAAPKRQKKRKNPGPQARAATPAKQGNKLTTGELRIARQNFEKCWQIPTGLDFSEETATEIKVSFDKDGFVMSAVAVVSDAPSNARRQVRESAIAAVLNPRCNPLPLPVEKYSQWKTLFLTFDPAWPS